ncbi:MAG: peptidoglycan-binding protein [Paracoccaceae bacterium]
MTRIMMLILLMATWVGSAQAQIAACYRLDMPVAPIAEMTVTGGGALSYTEVGRPYVVYSGFCPIRENGRTVCGLECDGGRLIFTHSGSGLELKAEHARIEAMQFDSLLNLANPLDADGASLEGTWQLTSTDPAACRDLETRAPDIAFEPGDLHPRVAELEAYLLAGGYFLGGPDMIYDRETAAAVALFQRGAGLEPTGHASRRLLQRIGAEAVLAFGGC